MLNKKDVYVLGVGHNTPVFIDLAEQCGYKVVGLFHYNDDRTKEFDHGFEILGSFKELLSNKHLVNMSFVLSMGDNLIRSNIAKKIWALGGHIPSLIHPTSIVSRFSKIGRAVYISAFSFVQADTIIGDGTVILSSVNISHNNIIGNYCFIAGGATIGAYTTIEDFVFIGQGALSISGKVPLVGHNAYIGARSLVTKSISSNEMVTGSPARPIKKRINE